MCHQQNVINTALSLVFFSSEDNPRLIMREISKTNPKRGPNIWLLLNVKVIKNKASLKNCPSQEELEER